MMSVWYGVIGCNETVLLAVLNSPRERVGVCFYLRWFVCLSVSDHDN